MTTIRLLAEIIALGGPVSIAQCHPRSDINTLKSHGIVEDAGIVQSVCCDECSQPHDAEVVFAANEYGIQCPDLGFIPKDRAGLVSVRPNLTRLIEVLANSLDCTRTKKTPIAENVWRVGALQGSAAELTLYFAPRLRDGNDLRRFEAAYSREPKTHHGIILTADGTLNRPPFKTLRLDECLVFDAQTGRFKFETDPFTLADAPVKSKGGRPKEYEPALTNLILKRRATGSALSTELSEAKMIRRVWKSTHKVDSTPSVATIKRAISEA